jgi:hypothetical protein
MRVVRARTILSVAGETVLDFLRTVLTELIEFLCQEDEWPN